MNKFDFIVYGNNVGALVSALELSKKHKVALVNPIPNWGAHFGGAQVYQQPFDAGMILFEFTSFHNKSDDLLSYNPAVRNDSARFFHLVEAYFASRLEYTQIPIPQCLVNGTFADDIMIANELDILRKLPKEIKEKIRAELKGIIEKGISPLHASNKKKDENLFLNTDYEQVSLANHGPTFHDLIVEPFTQGIFNVSTKSISALLHRIVWAPLFYPETLLKNLDNQVDSFGETPFHYPKVGYFSKTVEVLMNEIRQHGNIQIIQDKVSQIITKPNDTKIEFGESQIQAAQLVWCADIQTLINLTNLEKKEYPFKKASVTIAFVVVNSDEVNKRFSTLYVCDKNEYVYRASNQEVCANLDNTTNRLTFEFNTDRLESNGLNDDKSIIENLNQFLQKNNILKSELTDNQIVIKHFRKAVNLPMLENYNYFQEQFELVARELSHLEYAGPASNYAATSFNDQVVQGLKLGKKYN